MEFQRHINVLIVENNKVDSKMLKGMLQKSADGDFAIDCCDSIKDAFHILSVKPVDVVLLDLNIKDSNGLETLATLSKSYPDLAIVVNTGAYQDDLGLKAVTSGAQDYLIKGKYLPYGLTKALYYAIERKKAEKELKDAYNRLRDTQSQLIQAEKINVVGGLASGVAHEVKNPLATIVYGIEFLSTRVDHQDEKIKLTLDSIKEAATKANRIIMDLLDFASLSVLQKKPYDIQEVIERSLNLIRHQCDKHGVKINKEYSEDLPLIELDQNRIEQVLLDLFLNALHAMEKGGTLTIRICSKAFSKEDRGWITELGGGIKMGDPIVAVDICDTGKGINEEDLAKIFDPFFTTRRAAGGVGLGLSIARTIMNNHQGSIRITNSKDGGACAQLLFRAMEKPR